MQLESILIDPIVQLSTEIANHSHNLCEITRDSHFIAFMLHAAC